MIKLLLLSVLLVRFQTSFEAFAFHHYGRGEAKRTSLLSTERQRQIHPTLSDLHLRQPASSDKARLLTLLPRLWTTSKTSLSALSAPIPPTADNNSQNVQESTNEGASSRIIKIWVHLLSLFVIISYLQPLHLPDSLATLQTTLLDPLFTLLSNFVAALPFEVWSLIHAISGMIFGGSILCTTLIEWMWPNELALAKMVQDDGDDDNDDATTTKNSNSVSLPLIVNQMATQTLFPMEGKLVLPGVTGSMISGIAQSFYNYGSLRHAPVHVKSSLHLMFLFGVWWAVTDRQSQQDLTKLSNVYEDSETNDIRNMPTTEEEIVAVWKQRRLFNVISCVFVAALYGMMVLKPGFGA